MKARYVDVEYRIVGGFCWWSPEDGNLLEGLDGWMDGWGLGKDAACDLSSQRWAGRGGQETEAMPTYVVNLCVPVVLWGGVEVFERVLSWRDWI